MDLALRQVDLTRLEHALSTILSPLSHDECDDWRHAVESSVAELLDGDHVVFGIPRAAVPMHVHATNIPDQPQRAIQTLFGRLPDLPADPWLAEAERERLESKVEVWSRLRAFWRAAAGRPAALRRSSFLGEVVTPGRMHDSENIDWSVGSGHVALCVSYGNAETSVRPRRSSPRHIAEGVLRLLLPALKAGVTMRLAQDREGDPIPSLARLGLTRREADVARLLARRATNKEIAAALGMSAHTVRHHAENVFVKLGVHSRRAVRAHLEPH